MKTFKFSLVLRTLENTDHVFISLDDNIYGIHSKRINILYIYILKFISIHDILRHISYQVLDAIHIDHRAGLQK